MAKSKREPDILVLGDHPCAYLAAALLRQGAQPLRVVHGTIPGESTFDRLVAINPAFFDLHKLLTPLKKKLELTPVHGLKFLADEPRTRSEWSSKAVAAYVGRFEQVRRALKDLAEDAGADFVEPDSLELHSIDERALHFSLDGKTMSPRLLLLAGPLPPPQKRLLGLPPTWEAGVLHRYTFLKLNGGKWLAPGNGKPAIRMSLDLKGMLCWAWLTPGPQGAQLAVEQPAETVSSVAPQKLLRHWADVLHRHGELSAPADEIDEIDFASAQSLDMPLAGALAQEGVANRTLLLGPAGGFYTACAEDIYPNCWSSLFAADAAKKALAERHVQDALQVYRQKWCSTLGDFLRGPQQNLRFLLPLVYRNPTMTARLAEAIMLGKSVVR